MGHVYHRCCVREARGDLDLEQCLDRVGRVEVAEVPRDDVTDHGGAQARVHDFQSRGKRVGDTAFWANPACVSLDSMVG